jgi:hypothetical protein
MSIYDSEGGGGDNIYAGGDELVVPDWDVNKGAPSAPANKLGAAGGGGTGTSVAVLCGKKTSQETVKKLTIAGCVSLDQLPASKAWL